MEQVIDNLLKTIDDIHLVEISNVLTAEEYDKIINTLEVKEDLVNNN